MGKILNNLDMYQSYDKIKQDFFQLRWVHSTVWMHHMDFN